MRRCAVCAASTTAKLRSIRSIYHLLQYLLAAHEDVSLQGTLISKQITVLPCVYDCPLGHCCRLQ
jgi:hypothetical protein